MPKPTNEHLDALFMHHPPTQAQVARYEAIRRGARLFAQILVDNTPGSADQMAALRELRICVMTANAAIALEHTYDKPILEPVGGAN